MLKIGDNVRTIREIQTQMDAFGKYPYTLQVGREGIIFDVDKPFKGACLVDIYPIGVRAFFYEELELIDV